MTERERFEKFLRFEPETGCRVWIGVRVGRGYGNFWFRGRNTRAHRAAWILAGRVITAEKPFILHNCPAGDNPLCCEITHLWAGTEDDNAADMARKGRGVRSSKGLPYGVSALPSGRYAAEITHARAKFYLGVFGSAQDAARAATRKKEELLAERRPTTTRCAAKPRPGVRQLEALRLLHGAAKEWARPKDLGGSDHSWHSGALSRLVCSGLVRKRASNPGGARLHWMYQPTDDGRRFIAATEAAD